MALHVYVGRRADGTPIQVTRTVRAPVAKPGAGVRLADAELAKMVSKASNGKLAGASAATVTNVVEDYLEHCELEGRSPTTMREYRRIAAVVIEPKLGRVRADKLSAKQLNALYADLRDKGNKASSVRRVHALLAASFTYGYKQGVVDNSAIRQASPSTSSPPGRAPTAGQGDTRGGREGRSDGCHPAPTGRLDRGPAGELCALRWSDVDWSTKTLSIARSVYETAGGGWAEKDTKTHTARRIGLDPVAVEGLRRHRERVDKLAQGLELEVPSDAFVFSLSPIGTEPIRPDLVTKAAGRAARAAGVDTHLHALRHFAATQGIAAGRPRSQSAAAPRPRRPLGDIAGVQPCHRATGPGPGRVARSGVGPPELKVHPPVATIWYRSGPNIGS